MRETKVFRTLLLGKEDWWWKFRHQFSKMKIDDETFVINLALVTPWWGPWCWKVSLSQGEKLELRSLLVFFFMHMLLLIVVIFFFVHNFPPWSDEVNWEFRTKFPNYQLLSKPRFSTNSSAKVFNKALLQEANLAILIMFPDWILFLFYVVSWSCWAYIERERHEILHVSLWPNLINK